MLQRCSHTASKAVPTLCVPSRLSNRDLPSTPRASTNSLEVSRVAFSSLRVIFGEGLPLLVVSKTSNSPRPTNFSSCLDHKDALHTI